MESLLGPLGLLVAAIAVILGAIKKPPLWYTPAAYETVTAELERVRAEADAAMRQQQAGSAAIISEWKETAEKWQKLALVQSGVIERTTTVAVAVVKPGDEE